MPEKPDNIIPITPDARTAAQKFGADHDRELLTLVFTDLVEWTKSRPVSDNVEAAPSTALHLEVLEDEPTRIERVGASFLYIFTKLENREG